MSPSSARHTPERVLILGASRGIGLAFALQYRRDGAEVWATVRHPDARQRLADAGIRDLLLDVCATDAPSALAAAAEATLFDVVVFNAGVYGPQTQGLQAPEREVFDEVMHTNVLAPMRLLPVIAEHLEPQARVGFISSRMGSIGLRTNASGWLYRASKAALNSVMADAAHELNGRALCVALHPGWVRTDMGGPQADLAVDDSVADLRRTLAGLTPTQHGAFLNHDGTPLAW